MATKVPATFRKLIGTKLSTNFREATAVQVAPMPTPGANEVLVKNSYLGINASDINFTAGRYDPTVKPPFDLGFEGIGRVVAAGEKCSNMVGKSVTYYKFGAFAEYVVVPSKFLIPLPSIKPEYVPLVVSGLTAAISLDKVGEIKSGETVLVTAAAGGTGQFAVQLAKAAGCHVIGTCSSDDKAEFLKTLGCDRTINYRTENLHTVLQKEYPRGVDVVYECVGGEMFDAAVKNIARKGRIIIIGFVSGYHNEKSFQPKSDAVATLPSTLLTQSASVRGFFLNHYSRDLPEYMTKLVTLYGSGKIRSVVDMGTTEGKPFVGLETVADAVDYMYEKKNKGKVMVKISDSDAKL